MSRASRAVILAALTVALIGPAAGLRAVQPAGGNTVWIANPSHAPRIARVEAPRPFPIEDEAPVSLALAEWMALFKIPGLSVAVFDQHALVWAKAYGVREAGGAEPVTIDTLFQAGSISKPVAAMAVLRQVQAGRFSLDEDINNRLTSWKVPENEFTREQKVTLRRLLSHSAGTTVHGFPGYAPGEPRPTLVQVLDGEKPANTAPVRVDVVPGTITRYSGGGTTIAQLMMVDQLKKPFPQIMREAVLDPLGLANSTYEQPLPASRAAMAASGTRADGRTVEGRWHVYPEMAAAGLWTTASDLAAIAVEVAKSRAGRSARVLSKEMTAEMLRPQSESFGIGFGVERGTDRFFHNGADEGFQAQLTALADSGSGVVVMANSDNGSLVFPHVVASIAAEYGWTALSPSAPPAGVKLGVLARLRGAARAVAWYRTQRAARGGAAFRPADLNRLGYQLLREGRGDDALAVFRANVELYPDDANAHDSLGEALAARGESAAALVSYRRSLALDPKNANAVRMIEKLERRSPQP